MLCKSSSGERATTNKCSPPQTAPKTRAAAAALGHLGSPSIWAPCPLSWGSPWLSWCCLPLSTSGGSLSACCLDFPHSFWNAVKACWKVQGCKFHFIVRPHGPSLQIGSRSSCILLHMVVPSAESLRWCCHRCSCSFWLVRLRLETAGTLPETLTMLKPCYSYCGKGLN